MHPRAPRRVLALLFSLLTTFSLAVPALAASLPAAEGAERTRAALLEALAALPHFASERAERYLAYVGREGYSPERILRLVNTDGDLAPYEDMSGADIGRGVLVLVNKHNELGRYAPDDLVPMGRYGSWGCLRREARDAFASLCDAAAEEGLRIWGISPYRSYGRQEGIYYSYVRAHGQEEADTYSARPGASEHQTGLAVDVAVRGESYEDFGGTPESDWMRAHAHEFGYILRYDEGAEEITGYMYEPWHYRYVGVEAATFIWENSLTFEEYYYYYVCVEAPPEAELPL